MRDTLGMTIMVCALVIGIPLMAVAWRRSPTAGFWFGVSAIAAHSLGRWIYGW